MRGSGIARHHASSSTNPLLPALDTTPVLFAVRIWTGNGWCGGAVRHVKADIAILLTAAHCSESAESCSRRKRFGVYLAGSIDDVKIAKGEERPEPDLVFRKSEANRSPRECTHPKWKLDDQPEMKPGNGPDLSVVPLKANSMSASAKGKEFMKEGTIGGKPVPKWKFSAIEAKQHMNLFYFDYRNTGIGHVLEVSSHGDPGYGRLHSFDELHKGDSGMAWGVKIDHPKYDYVLYGVLSYNLFHNEMRVSDGESYHVRWVAEESKVQNQEDRCYWMKPYDFLDTFHVVLPDQHGTEEEYRRAEAGKFRSQRLPLGVHKDDLEPLYATDRKTTVKQRIPCIPCANVLAKARRIGQFLGHLVPQGVTPKPSPRAETEASELDGRLARWANGEYGA